MPAVEQNLIPEKDDSFVKFAITTIFAKLFSRNYSILRSLRVCRVMVKRSRRTAMSLGRELIRVNITVETDEDDLIGGFRLVDGNTAHNGVIGASKEVYPAP